MEHDVRGEETGRVHKLPGRRGTHCHLTHTHTHTSNVKELRFNERLWLDERDSAEICAANREKTRSFSWDKLKTQEAIIVCVRFFFFQDISHESHNCSESRTNSFGAQEIDLANRVYLNKCGRWYLNPAVNWTDTVWLESARLDPNWNEANEPEGRFWRYDHWRRHCSGFMSCQLVKIYRLLVKYLFFPPVLLWNERTAEQVWTHPETGGQRVENRLQRNWEVELLVFWLNLANLIIQQFHSWMWLFDYSKFTSFTISNKDVL